MDATVSEQSVSSDDQKQEVWHRPLEAVCAEHEGRRVVVGVAIVSKSNKLLLVQRAAVEDEFPNMYELPGGNRNPEDNTISHIVVRETSEETGLAVKRIVHEFPGFEYDTSRGRAQQFNFFVELDESTPLEDGLPTLKLDPKEHQAYTWVGPEDSLEQFPMSKDMKVVVQNALAAMAALSAKVA
ncbi:NUDIX hydrolase domain-like protein [Mycena polygramma]|nr:NUDIX hydrolase domain-like protein [Mycena polygramma]